MHVEFAFITRIEIERATIKSLIVIRLAVRLAEEYGISNAEIYAIAAINA